MTDRDCWLFRPSIEIEDGIIVDDLSAPELSVEQTDMYRKAVNELICSMYAHGYFDSLKARQKEMPDD